MSTASHQPASHRLERFLLAQQPVMERVIAELRNGRKESHWMWFIFPQIAGLGHSPMAKQYAIASLDEAIAYLKHPLLGMRLHDCSSLVLRIQDASIEQVFPYPDHLKFHSSMTLFSRAAEAGGLVHRVFHDCLQRHFRGQPDTGILERI